MIFNYIQKNPAAPIDHQTDRFGWSVAVSGAMVVVGAYHDESAYVFDCTNASNCIQKSKLVAVNDTGGHHSSLGCLMSLDVVGSFGCHWMLDDVGSCWISLDVVTYWMILGVTECIECCWMDVGGCH